MPNQGIDLIITSLPYCDQRKNTYGGIHPDHYVEWFLPIAKELKRVLRPDGSFVLNDNPTAIPFRDGEIRGRLMLRFLSVEI